MNYKKSILPVIYGTSLTLSVLSTNCYAEHRYDVNKPFSERNSNEQVGYLKRCVMVKMMYLVTKKEVKLKQSLEKMLKDECKDLPLTKSERKLLDEVSQL